MESGYYAHTLAVQPLFRNWFAQQSSALLWPCIELFKNPVQFKKIVFLFFDLYLIFSACLIYFKT